MIKEIFEILLWFFIGYFLYANLVSIGLLILAFFEVRKSIHSGPMIESIKRHSSRLAPSVSIISPAYNESGSIVQSAQSFLTLDYPDFEVIIVNDGSTDSTLHKLIENFRLVPAQLFYDARLSHSKVRGVYQSEIHHRLIVVDKENGGKADSINVGIGFARKELFCAVDSDSILDSDALIRVAIPFIEEPELTVASGGTIRPVNGSLVRYGRVIETKLPQSFLARVQVVEYLRAFLFGRVGWNVLNSTLIISGAFGLFKTRAVMEAGGYREHSLGEDMELVVHLRNFYERKNEEAHISFVPDPICWTEVPAQFSVLRRQRDRWQRGLAGSLFRYRRMFFNPRFGFAGMIAFPYFFIVELFGPFVELGAYLFAVLGIILGYFKIEILLLFFLVDILFGMMMSFTAVLIEESAYHKYPKLSDLFRLFMAAMFEHLGYRQFVSFARMLGLIKYFIGARKWGEMKREGFGGGISES